VKAGWRAATLDEVCDEITDGSHFSPKTTEEGFPYVTVRDLDNDQIDFDNCRFVSKAAFKQLLANGCKPNKGDVLFSKDGTVGKVALVDYDMDFVVLSSLAIIRPDKKLVDSAFLKYVLKSPAFLEEAVGKKTGVALRRIILRNLKSITIPIPPLPEQQRIVGVLDEAFEGIATAKANAETNLQNARALFESHLQSVFSRRGAGWVNRKLGEMCERITKGSSPKWQGIAYVDEPGILFVTSENVGEYQILIEHPKYVEEKFNTKDKKSILQKGDVLSNIVGASIGRTAVFDRTDVANINQAVCLLRCEPDQLNNFFLTYLLNSPVFKQVLHDNEVDNARANLSLGFFSQLLVPTPPLSEQGKIVTALDSLREEAQRLESIYQQKLSALDALKESLLHQAFTGNL